MTNDYIQEAEMLKEELFRKYCETCDEEVRKDWVQQCEVVRKMIAEHWRYKGKV